MLRIRILVILSLFLSFSLVQALENRPHATYRKPKPSPTNSAVILKMKEGDLPSQLMDEVKEQLSEVLKQMGAEGQALTLDSDELPPELKEAIEKQLKDELQKTKEENKENVPEEPSPGEKEYELATEILSRKDYDNADYIAALEASATLGYSDAGAELGKEFLYGSHTIRNFSRAVQEFQWAASAGHPDAQYYLGYFYTVGGGGLKVDPALSLLYYAFAGRSGHLEASMAMGYRTMNGISVSHSCSRALHYYKLAADIVVAEHQDENADLELRKRRLANGEMDIGDENEHRIVEYVQQAAEAGDAHSMNTMGQLQYHGQYGVAQDRDGAQDWFQRAAEHGNGQAHAHLGHILSNQAEPDYEAALKHYKAALAIKNDSTAHVGLGVLYMEGRGVEKDLALARRHFAKAAEKRNPEGMVNLGQMYMYGMGTSVDYKRAGRLFFQASQLGSTIATYNLGLLHHEGLGTPKDCMAATKLYKNVVETGTVAKMIDDAHTHFVLGDNERALIQYEIMGQIGFEIAQHNAAWMYDNGYGNELIRERTELENDELESERYGCAILFYRRSASQHNVVATLRLGDIYYYGLGAEKSIETAASFYSDSCKVNSPEGLYNVGIMHQYGIGLPQDFFLAKRYLDLSIRVHQGVSKFPVYLALVGLGAHFLWSRPGEVIPLILSSDEISSTLKFPVWAFSIVFSAWEYILLAVSIIGLVIVTWMRRDRIQLPRLVFGEQDDVNE